MSNPIGNLTNKVATVASSSEIKDALTNLITNITPWWDVIRVFSILSGFVLIVWSAISLFKAGDMFSQRSMGGQQGQFAKIVGSLVGGVFLVNLGSFLDMVSQSFFAKDSMDVFSAKNSILASSFLGGAGVVYMKLTVITIVIVGLLSVTKGCVMLKNSMENSSIFGQALTHIIGGMFAINIVQVIKMLGATLGGTIGTNISQMFK